jgi:hypothetical protein
MQGRYAEPQPRRQALGKSVLYVGLDVHKMSLDAGIAGAGEFIPGLNQKNQGVSHLFDNF